MCIDLDQLTAEGNAKDAPKNASGVTTVHGLGMTMRAREQQAFSYGPHLQPRNTGLGVHQSGRTRPWGATRITKLAPAAAKTRSSMSLGNPLDSDRTGAAFSADRLTGGPR
jgi:hypothetical protein